MEVDNNLDCRCDTEFQVSSVQFQVKMKTLRLQNHPHIALRHESCGFSRNLGLGRSDGDRSFAENQCRVSGRRVTAGWESLAVNVESGDGFVDTVGKGDAAWGGNFDGSGIGNSTARIADFAGSACSDDEVS